MARKYTDEEVQAVREMRDNGKTRAEIGKFLGVGVKAVDSLVTEHGLVKDRKPVIPADREAEFRKMWAENVPINQMKSVLGVSYYAVVRHATRLELPPRERKIEITAQQAGHDRRNGVTTSEAIPAFHPATWAMLWPNGQPEWAGRPV